MAGRVLIITYEFPPRGGVCSVRTSKTVKYLPRFGWEPVVLTVLDTPSNLTDTALVEELAEDLQVHRSYSIEPTRLLRAMKRFLARSSDTETEGASNSDILYSYTGLPLGTIEKIKAFAIPDEKIGWYPFALASSLATIRKTGAEVIFSTAPPFTTHLIAAACKRLSGLPWACEFRDPLVDYTRAEPPIAIRKRIDCCLESYMLHRADAVICTTQETADGFKQRYADIGEERYHVITGGFDRDDFAWSPPLEEKFTMTWIGTMFGSRLPQALFTTVRDMLHDGSLSPVDFKLSIVGTMDVESFRFVQDLGLEDIVELTGFVEHRESIRRMQASHLLLVKLGKGKESEIIYPAKIFEYFASRRPILALVHEGATADLIRRMGAGTVIKPDDKTAIRDAILDNYSRFKRGCMSTMGDIDMIAEFDKEMLSGKLAHIFDLITGREEAG